MDDMPTGLIRRGAAYSLRRRIPLDLISAFDGRREIVRALGTKDREEAKRRHAKAWVELDEQFAAARLQQSHDLGAHLQAKIRQIKDGWRRDPRPAQTITDEELEYVLERMAMDREEEGREEAEYEGRELHRHRLTAVLNVDNLDLLSDEEKALRDIILDLRRAKELAEEKARLAEKKLLRMNTVHAQAPVAIQPKRPTTSSLTGVVERWALERKPADKTVDAHSAVVRWFTERTGVNQVDQVDRDHVQAFKSALLAEGASASNIRTKLSRLRTILGFAVSEGSIPTNPAIGVAAPRSKGPPPRRPWNAADLNKLFAGPVHQKGERPVRGRGEAAYWMPLLALFTGARREELGQLRGKDILPLSYADADNAEREAWCIRIDYGEDGQNRIKTASSERIVPLHPSLVELGFITFVEKAQPDGLIFPKLRPNKNGQLTEKWGEWFREYRLSCGLPDVRLKFHSFRHAFKDFCREAGINEGVQRQLMGHAASSVADLYGSGFPTHVLVAAISSYRVPGLTLPPAPLGLSHP